MFNWLFGKKKGAVTENIVESTGTKNVSNKNVFEVFEDLAPVFKDNQKALTMLHMLPEVYIVLNNNLVYESVGCSYLTQEGQYVTIHKGLQYNVGTALFTTKTQVQPPVIRIAENLYHNFKKWDFCYNTNPTMRIFQMWRDNIFINIETKTLKVGDNSIALDVEEVGILCRIVIDLLNNKLKEEETQKRAAMDEVVAELLKGE